MGMDVVHKAVERVARESRARLVALLASRSHDIAGAEDALADAFIAALASWPADGVPRSPEAWLMTVARRRLIARARHERVRERTAPTLQATFDEVYHMAHAQTTFPDERLKLMFVCAHPAIDALVRAPLMLQTVFGLDAARIARAFLVSPSTMGQRLVRAKNKIRATRPGFEIPQSHALPTRLDAVLDAIYVAYGTGWEEIGDGNGLACEALELGTLLHSLLPNQPEVMGLVALMLFCESRREARRDSEGRYVPLSEQTPRRWSIDLIERADSLLRRMAAMSQPGRFQLEAAIQSVHADRLRTGETDWRAILSLYDLLVLLSPSVGARLARIAALAEVHGARAAWNELENLDIDSVARFQPYWALTAHLLAKTGRIDEAEVARAKAIDLSIDMASRAHLEELQFRDAKLKH